MKNILIGKLLFVVQNKVEIYNLNNNKTELDNTLTMISNSILLLKLKEMEYIEKIAEIYSKLTLFNLKNKLNIFID